MEKDKKCFVDELMDYYNGHVSIVKLQRYGHRCGYVRVNDHELFERIAKWYESWSEEFDFDVHGGITFVQSDPGKEYLPEGDWIGFDCNHLGDAIDVTALFNNFDISDAEFSLVVERFKLGKGGKIRSTDYVRKECQSLIDQLIKLGDKRL